MSDRTLLLKLDPLILFWREAASALCLRDAASRTEETSGASGTESVGAESSEVAVLWHKASKSEILSCLQNAASEILKRGAKIMASIAELYGKAKELWSEHWVPSEPHQELIPWVALFRPIQARNYVWEYTWPEEEYLHP